MTSFCADDFHRRSLSIWSRLAACVLLCCVSSAYAAAPMQFARLNAEQGLSAGGVMAIHQDAQGFMWFGSEDGLDRYDGYAIKHYVHDRDQPKSLPDNWIAALAEDSQGTLWIGMSSAGVVARQSNGEFEPLPSLKDERIRKLHIDKQGRLWIATRDRGLVMLSRDRTTTQRYRSVTTESTTLDKQAILSSDSVFALAEEVS